MAKLNMINYKIITGYNRLYNIITSYTTNKKMELYQRVAIYHILYIQFYNE